MKRQQITQLHEKTKSQLQQQLAELQQELTKKKMELKAAKLEDVKLPSRLKADIARIKTILREKEKEE